MCVILWDVTYYGGNIVEREAEYRRKEVEEYKKIVSPFFKYISWLEKSAGTSVSSLYTGQNIEAASMSFPVYDGTLLNLIKQLSKSELMDHNYPYVYSKYRLQTPEQERYLIKKATITEWGNLKAVLSKYVLGGMTKATLWNEGVQEQIFYLILNQMKTIIEWWDKPIDVSSL